MKKISKILLLLLLSIFTSCISFLSQDYQQFQDYLTKDMDVATEFYLDNYKKLNFYISETEHIKVLNNLQDNIDRDITEVEKMNSDSITKIKRAVIERDKTNEYNTYFKKVEHFLYEPLETPYNLLLSNLLDDYYQITDLKQIFIHYPTLLSANLTRLKMETSKRLENLSTLKPLMDLISSIPQKHQTYLLEYIEVTSQDRSVQVSSKNRRSSYLFRIDITARDQIFTSVNRSEELVDSTRITAYTKEKNQEFQDIETKIKVSRLRQSSLNRRIKELEQMTDPLTEELTLELQTQKESFTKEIKETEVLLLQQLGVPEFITVPVYEPYVYIRENVLTDISCNITMRLSKNSVLADRITDNITVTKNYIKYRELDKSDTNYKELMSSSLKGITVEDIFNTYKNW